MTTVSIPVEIREGEPNRAYVWSRDGKDCLIYADTHKSPAMLRQITRDNVMSSLETLRRRESNRDRLSIGCEDGTVLLVEHYGECWGYTDLRSGSGALGQKTFADASRDALEHATQSYGGVAWQRHGYGN